MSCDKQSNSHSLSLSTFKEKITLSNNTSLNYTAYRMDGNSNIDNMGKYANLGTPSCCDYLYILNNKEAIIIEDTKLLQKIEKDEHISNYNSNSEEKPIIIKQFKEIISKKYCLKAYGSYLILVLLKQKYKNIATELKEKKFSFWFVINDTDNIKAYDWLELPQYLKKNFQQALSAQFGVKLFQKTEVLFEKEFKQKLHQ